MHCGGGQGRSWSRLSSSWKSITEPASEPRSFGYVPNRHKVGARAVGDRRRGLSACVGRFRQRAAVTSSAVELGELEETRDRLVQRVHDARCRTESRVEFERRSRALLERMKLEPGRYKFVRLPAADVGGSGCGVYQVRPRLGIIGMLAGWWELSCRRAVP